MFAFGILVYLSNVGNIKKQMGLGEFFILNMMVAIAWPISIPFMVFNLFKKKENNESD